MKKIIVSLGMWCFLGFQGAKACAWYEPDEGYFNLFTQTIVADKSFTPFLLSYSSAFYEDPAVVLPDDNLELWCRFFQNKLSGDEVKRLVYELPMADLEAFKQANRSGDKTLRKLGNYDTYREGLDYLIEAKKMENLRINKISEEEDSYFLYEEPKYRLASVLDYSATLSNLKALYAATQNKDIRLRYAYQMVRFEHYNRNYEQAVEAFRTYVEPVGLKNAVYYMALEQMAGAQRGLGQKQEANWNFFQVFIHTKSRKQTAYVSIKLSDEKAFEDLLSRAQNDEEKVMAYFLLGYQGFNNPFSMMEKIYAINPNAEVLKVLQARAINELERLYLPYDYYADTDGEAAKTAPDVPKAPSGVRKSAVKKELSFWDKVVAFFKSIFGGSDSVESVVSAEEGEALSDKTLLNHPNRLPLSVSTEQQRSLLGEQIEALERFAEKVADQSEDPYWRISQSYLKFLQKDYQGSEAVLKTIQTQDRAYLAQISRMNLLNAILSRPRIDEAFENHMIKTYPELVEELSGKNKTSTVSDFIVDILANRYFLQGEHGKSFLMNNRLSDLQYSLDMDLVSAVESFYLRKDKTLFERKVVAKNIDTGGDTANFFNVLYGDHQMRLAHFDKALAYYNKVNNFQGIPRYDYEQNRLVVEGYNGYRGISPLVFGHNVWESFQSPESESMRAESFIKDYPFIKPNMNKKELAEAALELEKTGRGNTAKAAQANQLIGNLLYNTSILGYYRHYFVADIDNSNGGKYDFSELNIFSSELYYKSFPIRIASNDFDKIIGYYKKALDNTTDREVKARLLFQMASAEQGKYYQWEASQPQEYDYSASDWEEKQSKFEQKLAAAKNGNYRTYFTELKQNYADTETSRKLMGQCSYYNYFMQK
ncbi:hypothetical protein [Bergeyella sp. RCAD1439]|uniref:hypothetical protein n=1 Tax=Bergeyella anatis TaxID=3113737 RepID=UPI002E19DADB|nr:hypothetical protein [Bergeyella sp. RCAD1439]